MDSITPLLLALATAVAAIGGTAISRFIDQWFARKANVGPLVAETNAARTELIDTLEQTATARADRIASLEEQLAAEQAARAREVADLTARVQRLETALNLALDRLRIAKVAVTDIPLPPTD